MKPAAYLTEIRAMTEQAEVLIDAVVEIQPAYLRLQSWQWGALMGLREVAATKLAAYATSVYGVLTLDEDDLEAIRILNEAYDKLGIPCQSPSVQDTESWISEFAEIVGEW